MAELTQEDRNIAEYIRQYPPTNLLGDVSMELVDPKEFIRNYQHHLWLAFILSERHNETLLIWANQTEILEDLRTDLFSRSPVPIGGMYRAYHWKIGSVL